MINKFKRLKYWIFLILFIISGNSFSQNLLINPGAETGNTEGWIDPDDAWGAAAEITPHEGSYFFWPSRKGIAYTQMYQDVTVSGYSSDSYFHLSGWLANWDQSPHDKATLAIAALDANGNQLFYASREHRNPVWGYYEIVAQLPVGCKTLRVYLIATRFVGYYNDGYFDDLYLEIINDLPDVFVTITSEGDKRDIEIGSTLQLTANTTGGSDGNYIWSSSYDGIASVDENGLVTAHSSGSFTIQAIGNTTQALGYITLLSHPQNYIRFTNPEGGEEWEAGSDKNITWEVIGVINSSTLYWSSNDGTDWDEISPITDPSIGQYLWSLPDTNEAINNCLLKISWSDNETISSRFSIVPSNGPSGSQKIILEENFDETPFPPNGWSIIQFNSTNTWKQGNVTENDFNEIDPTSVNSAICPWKNEDQNEWLVSPSFALSNGDAYIDFYAGYSTQWLANATLKLHISIDDGNNWTELWEAENDGNPWGWRQKNIDITSYAGYSNLKVAWQYLGNDGDIVAIDNVKITGFDETTDIYEQKEISVNYKLSQNYPNPFNPTTVISYGIPTQTDVKIIIYDLLGNEIKTLIDQEQVQGYKKVVWDSTDKYGKKVGAGIYIYQIQTDYFIATRKMVLVK